MAGASVAVAEEAARGDVPVDCGAADRRGCARRFVVGYNRIRAADVRVDEALGGIDVQLTRRASPIPALVTLVPLWSRDHST